MNTEHRKPQTANRKRLPGTSLDFFDTREAINAIKPDVYEKLPYTFRVFAENLVRRCDPALLTDALTQIIERKQGVDFPWYPARVVCHDILGQTALVDLAGLRDAIAEKGGILHKSIPSFLHNLLWITRCPKNTVVLKKMLLIKIVSLKIAATKTAFTLLIGQKKAFKNVDVIPPGNGIMHQINLEKMSPVVHALDGIAFPDTLVGTDSHTPHVIAIGVGGLEAENVMLGRASYMRLPDIVGVKLAGKRQPGITATDIVLAITEFLRNKK